jgi:drug/metabolite transporter (DMT)-like permease
LPEPIRPIKAYLALCVSVIGIACAPILVHWAKIPGPASAFYRLLFAVAVLLPWVIVHRQRVTAMTRRSVLIAALGGVFFAADLAFYNTAVLATSAANASLLGNNAPLFVGLLSWALMGRRPRAAFVLGLLLSFTGSVTIAGTDFLHHAKLGAADLMALAASVCFAVYLLAIERVRATTDSVTLLTVALSASTVMLLIFNLTVGISLRIPDGESWAALIALSLLAQVIAYLGLTYALGHLPATVTSVSLLAQTPLTAILAVFLLGEPITAIQLTGGALLLLGIWVVNRYA